MRSIKLVKLRVLNIAKCSVCVCPNYKKYNKYLTYEDAHIQIYLRPITVCLSGYVPPKSTRNTL